MISGWYLNLLVLLLQVGDITASVRWPKGTYALLKPKTGCPEEWEGNSNIWDEYGWILQHTNSTNTISKVLHIEGEVFSSEVLRHFCVKTSGTQTTGSRHWPEGQYCIYSQNSMLLMKGGEITMFSYMNKNSAIKNEYENYFARLYSNNGNYDYIVFCFACQTSGNKKTPIELPITKPFYLLPYGSRDCQQVKWMIATREWIKYHTRNYDSSGSNIYGYYIQQTYGEVPYYKMGNSTNKGITMYYCYYQSCNYTLNRTKGVLQSPGFPVKYPDGQLCSWRIMVPANHTVHVNFTHFSLYEYDQDCLQLYKNISYRFKLKQAFFGHQQPFTITATSDLMFVFRSDEENNSTGFRAEYKIVKIPEKTTTAKPLTTTSLPTTEKPTTDHPTTLVTTKLPTTKQPTTKQPTTKEPTTKPCITTETTTFTSTKTNINSTTNDTVLSGPTKHKSSNYHNVPILKKTCFCDETWRIVVMVLPLVVFILIVVVTIDIVCRCKNKKAAKSKTRRSVDDRPVVNPTYGRGDISLDHATHNITDDSALNTDDGQTLSQVEPPDYEDVDYIPPPNRNTGYSEGHVLEPLTNGAPEMFYRVLEPPADASRPTYENLSEVNHYTTDPVYEAEQNSGAFVEVNILYDQYMA